MIHFDSDYTEGAHPDILKMLQETNMEQTCGYGEDSYCDRAAGLLKELCQAPQADVHFITGGTQANLTLIAAALRPHQGVISADTGHIAVHESGAIEATGHKVLTLPNRGGKLSAGRIRKFCESHYQDETHEHMVQPGMVYLSQPTELGTLYSARELSDIRDVCLEFGMFLYVDGARCGYGLASESADFTLPQMAELCDAFYIGGTKVGALFGEALLILNPALKKDFRYILKQRVGRLAKGRILGLQFLALFQDGLYFRISEHADRQARRIRDAFADCGFPLLIRSDTNQQFPVLPDSMLERLSEKYVFSYWQRIDALRSAVRVCTSWATPEENVDQLIRDVRALSEEMSEDVLKGMNDLRGSVGILSEETQNTQDTSDAQETQETQETQKIQKTQEN